MDSLKNNLIKVLAEATWLKENYRISLSDHQQSLNDILNWVEECLELLKGRKNDE